jgi:hypothetical protein
VLFTRVWGAQLFFHISGRLTAAVIVHYSG